MVINRLLGHVFKRLRRPIRSTSSSLVKASVPQTWGGFTLIELLVAMLISSIVITSLLSFMNTILQNDRTEQAKAFTEQDIQDGIDFIAEDMREAVFIYDWDALWNNNNADPTLSGIGDQIPPRVGNSPGCPTTPTIDANSTCLPVLAFWKREILPQAIAATSTGYTTTGCTLANSATALCNRRNDAFVYSLVVYYYITSGPTPDQIWRGAARIGRFSIRDGVKNPNGPSKDNLDPGYDSANPLNPSNYNYISSLIETVSGTPATDNANCASPSPGETNCPSPGFQLFNLNIVANAVEPKMNSWRRFPSIGTEVFSTQTLILLDHIDPNWVLLSDLGFAAGTTPCDALSTSQSAGTLSPRLLSNGTTFHVPGFYACVNPEQRTASIFIRGNALTRLNPNWKRFAGLGSTATLDNRITFTPGRAVYFPTATLPNAQGRGFVAR